MSLSPITVYGNNGSLDPSTHGIPTFIHSFYHIRGEEVWQVTWRNPVNNHGYHGDRFRSRFLGLILQALYDTNPKQCM